MFESWRERVLVLFSWFSGSCFLAMLLRGQLLGMFDSGQKDFCSLLFLQEHSLSDFCVVEAVD